MVLVFGAVFSNSAEEYLCSKSQIVAGGHRQQKYEEIEGE